MARFDAHARDYDAWYGTALGRYVDRVEKGLIEELAQPAPGDRALDLGCGTGNHSLWLAEKGLAATGLDESRAMLEVAVARTTGAGVRVGYVRGDVVALPFESGQFDLVVSVAAAEFVTDRRSMLREAKRVLKPGVGWCLDC